MKNALLLAAALFATALHAQTAPPPPTDPTWYVAIDGTGQAHHVNPPAVASISPSSVVLECWDYASSLGASAPAAPVGQITPPAAVRLARYATIQKIKWRETWTLTNGGLALSELRVATHVLEHDDYSAGPVVK